MVMTKRFVVSNFCFGLAIVALGCGKVSQEENSKPLVTDVDHSVVKRQSVGNCWLYAQASWVESLHLTATGNELDVSESYWTYWYWYEQILKNANRGYLQEELVTGGSWSAAQRLLRRYGVVLEGEFIPREAEAEMSRTQARAESLINQELVTGQLASLEDRTPDKIMAVLDQAFGVNMNEARAMARSIDDFQVATGRDQQEVASLRQVMGEWRNYSAGRVRKETLIRYVKRALNDGHPIVMTMWIDFRYLNTQTATFQDEIFNEDYDGTGGHLVVLEDYVVNHPELGFLGEGDMDDSIKEAALDGELLYFKSKNSWGTNRPDRGLTDGYTRFTKDYLWNTTREEIGYNYTSFVLPVGLY